MKTNIATTDLVDTFLKLVKIPSPSGKEKLVAKEVSEKMKEAGFEVWFDEAGKINNSDTGNVYAYLEVNKDFSTLVFSAHTDTVQMEGEIVKPIVEGDIIKSDGSTILGADNKAGVAILLTAAELLKKESLNHNILFFFPTREEAGMMGSSQFNFKKTIIKYVFNMDSSDKPGVFIYKSLGYENFDIVVKGVSVHAAKSYEKGIDAIKSAGILLSKLPVGKNTKEGWTMNIGVISGGSGTNVVCDQVVLKGEMRAFTEETLEKLKKQVKEMCVDISSATGAEITFELDKDNGIPPFAGKASSDLIDFCKKTSKNMGLDFEAEESFSTSDANFYSSMGYETISVSRGGEQAHSKKETVKISDMQNVLNLVMEIVTSKEI